MIKSKITNGKVGISKESIVYPYANYAYHYLNAWDFPEPKSQNRYCDFGIDHFILTENGDFSGIEVRVRGIKLENLP